MNEEKSKYVLTMASADGTIYILDVLDPRSTLTNPIVDPIKMGSNDKCSCDYMTKYEDESSFSEYFTSLSPMSISPPDIQNKYDSDTDYETNDDGTVYEIESVKLSSDNIDISRRIIDRSILPDIEEMAFPDVVKAKANEIHSKFRISTKRGERRKRMIFFCIYHAYKDLDIPPDNVHISRIIGIDVKSIGKAFTECAPPNTGYIPRHKTIKSTDYISSYFYLTGLSEQNCDDVISMAKGIIQKDKTLKDEIPQIVAAGILLYFMEINGVTSDRDFPAALGKSALTLSNMKKKVEAVHNS